MIDARVFFKKIGRARFISHLDMTRAMTRAFSRAGLDVWYTEGFNPHMYLTFALPLSLGQQTICDYFDVRFNRLDDEKKSAEALNACLPEGLEIISIGGREYKTIDICAAEYEILLKGKDLGERWREFLSEDIIEVEKKSKRGMQKFDVKPHIKILSLDENCGELKLLIELPTGNKLNVNPALILDAFAKAAGVKIESSKICRMKICYNS